MNLLLLHVQEVVRLLAFGQVRNVQIDERVAVADVKRSQDQAE